MLLICFTVSSNSSLLSHNRPCNNFAHIYDNGLLQYVLLLLPVSVTRDEGSLQEGERMSQMEAFFISSSAGGVGARSARVLNTSEN